MKPESRHLSVHVRRPAGDVYAYVSDPANLAEWAAGLGSAPEQVDGRWVVTTPDGTVGVEFAPRNDFGVLDHRVTLPSGQTVDVPMRVIADRDGSEVIFTVRREEGMSDADFERDQAAVAADLATLKTIVEGQN